MNLTNILRGREKEFEKEFDKPITDEVHKYLNSQTSVAIYYDNSELKSFHRASFLAALEAMWKVAEKLSEETGCVGTFGATSRVVAKGWCCPRHYGQSDILTYLDKEIAEIKGEDHAHLVK